mmetsp:Transcript_15107/g.20848  ORF Transcript_15107/g.20848 Transcript_15107/m.20848 type:complete len:341 (-) Transcript_15107:134-1156(-)
MLPPASRLPRKCNFGEGHDGDDTVRWTNDDATVSKMSCADLNYLNDIFVKHFVKRRQKKPPLINRGYFSRVHAFHSLMKQFMRAFKDKPTQIISLGCGFDTTYFQFKDQNCAPTRYIEVDFPEVTSKKSAVIERTPELRGLLDPKEEGQPIFKSGGVVSLGYSLVPGDLRNLAEMEKALHTAGFDPKVPTLILAECVLVYLEASASAALLRYCSQLCDGPAAFVLYEQINPDDAFGRQMCKNLENRGIFLPGLPAYPNLDAQKSRFLSAGWKKVEAADMHTIHHKRLDPVEIQRINKLEIFDEFEEWQLIQSHYCIAHAVQHDSEGLLNEFGLFAKDSPF